MTLGTGSFQWKLQYGGTGLNGITLVMAQIDGGVMGARGLKCEVDGFGKTSREIGSV